MRGVWQRLTALLSAIVNWRYFKPAVFVACAVPLVTLTYSFWVVITGRNPDYLGADPKNCCIPPGKTRWPFC
jgi:hypothetical protein